MRALFVAATGMQSQQTNIDNIANNLANVNTAGFKRGRVDFQDLLYQAIIQPGANASADTEIPTGISLGYGSRPAAIQKVFTQGAYQYTQQENDICIEGNGFFEIEMPNGDTAYTRDGAFKVDSQGRLVTSNGDPLVPGITLPADRISTTIATDGTVSVMLPGQVQPAIVGNITLTRFPNNAGLQPIGQNLFVETASSGAPVTGTPGTDGIGELRQEYLEVSNVSIVDELVNMIISQRAYEINSKAITTSDEMLQIAVQLKR